MENKNVIESYIKTDISEDGKKMRESNINQFFKFYGKEKSIFELKTRDITNYYSELINNTKISEATKKNRFNIMRVFLKYVILNFKDMFYKDLKNSDKLIKMMEVNDTYQYLTGTKFKFGETTSKDHTILTPKELELFLQHLEYRNRKYFLLFGLYAFTGARKSTLIKLKINEVDLEGCKITPSKSKTGAKKYYYDSRLNKHLKPYIQTRKGMNIEYKELFLSDQLKPYSDRTFNLYIDKICKVLNMKHFTVQDFRFSLNDNREKLKGCDPITLEYLLGHKPTTVNKKYYTNRDNDDFNRKIYNQYNPYKTISI